MSVKREGRWDCDTCGTSGNMGGDKICPHCGAPRPVDTHFYLPEDEPPVSDPDKLRDAQAGPDWGCEYCGASNAGYRVTCKQCGASKGKSPSGVVRDYSLDDTPHGSKKEATWPCKNCGTQNPESASVCQSCGIARGKSGADTFTGHSAMREEPVYETPRAEPSYTTPRQRLPEIGLPSWLGPGAIVALILLFFAGVGYLVFHTEEHNLTVTGFSWERTIAVEAYRTVTESDWSVPQGGRMVSSSREIRSYNQVLDHYEDETYTESHQIQDGTYVCGHRDLKNGYFEDITCPKYTTVTETKHRQVPKYRQDPVYDTKYTYNIDKWVYDRTERSGKQDHEAYWPNVSLAGKERKGTSSENYVVYFTDEKGKAYTYGLGSDYSRWMTFNSRQVYIGSINNLGVIMELKSK